MPRSLDPPIIIAHRGASGCRPEHTLASYALAIDLGADFIEPDLVATKDGRLIARHEPEIGATTDVADKFPDRRRAALLDGVAVDGWFACDFTLAEIKTLRARQPWPFRANAWDGLYEIPTFEEIVQLARSARRTHGRVVGVYPETKHPTFHRDIGLALEEPLLRVLGESGWASADSPVFIQSFEVANLKALAERTDVRLIQLLDEAAARPFDFAATGDARTYGDMMRPAGLAEIAAYAWGIGPWKRSVIAENPDGRLAAPGSLIDDAHAANLRVHAYTFRDEPRFLAADYDGDPAAEYRQFFDLGGDGVFSDFPGTAARALARITAS